MRRSLTERTSTRSGAPDFGRGKPFKSGYRRAPCLPLKGQEKDQRGGGSSGDGGVLLSGRSGEATSGEGALGSTWDDGTSADVAWGGVTSECVAPGGLTSGGLTSDGAASAGLTLGDLTSGAVTLVGVTSGGLTSECRIFGCW